MEKSRAKFLAIRKTAAFTIGFSSSLLYEREFKNSGANHPPFLNIHHENRKSQFPMTFDTCGGFHTPTLAS